MGFLTPLTPEQKAARQLGEKLWAEFSELKAANQARLSRYADYEAEYEAHRNPNFQGALDDYGKAKLTAAQKRQHRVKYPYGHAITAKHAYRTAGTLPDLIVPRRNSSEPERFRGDTMEKMLYAAYGFSEAEMQFASGGHDGSLLGAGCYDVYWEADRQLPRFRSLYPGGVLTVDGIDNPHDFKRVYRFWRVGVHSFRAEYGEQKLPGGEDAGDVRCEEGTEQIMMVRYSDEVKTVTMAGGKVLTQYDHNYGFTPYIVIPNLGPIRKVWGYGDYEFYREVLHYFQRLVNKQADVIAAAAGGAYLEKNTGQTGAKIIDILRSGGVIHGRKDAELTPVEVAQMPAFIDTHFTMVREALNDIGFTPPASWGAIGSTSGSDRALQMAPQAELTALKQIHQSAGLKRLNTMLLKLISSKTVGKEITYTGVATARRRTDAFSITLGASTDEVNQLLDDQGQPLTNDDGTPYQLPQTPGDVIAGEYDTRVIFQRRIDRDDPQYILAELNKFQQRAQSLYTTLSNLGVESPEDEMNLIEGESERFPWLHPEILQILKDAMGGDDAQGDIASGLTSLMSKDGGGGAMGFDATSRGLNGSSNAGGQTDASVPGAYSGGA